jgi:two-component system OmpR family response regulator
LRSLRAQGVVTPALVLSALGSLQDRVDGFDEGCDDYLVKPFAFQELNARVLALSRRRGPGSASESTRLQAGGLSLDRLNREVVREGVRIELLPLEFRLLEILMLHAGTPVTRTMMLEKVWGFRFDPRTNIVETHISHLRAKLDQPGRPQPIRTIRGSGYVICAERPH